MKRVSVAAESIRLEGGTQARVELSGEVVRDYAERLRDGADLPPLTVFEDAQGERWLADGFHRLKARQSIGQVEVLVELREGERRDAVLFAVGANATHGLRRGRADVRKAIKILLEDEEWGRWSDREIARRVCCHHQTVARVREELGVDEGQTRLFERGGQIIPMRLRGAKRAPVEVLEGGQERPEAEALREGGQERPDEAEARGAHLDDLSRRRGLQRAAQLPEMTATEATLGAAGAQLLRALAWTYGPHPIPQPEVGLSLPALEALPPELRGDVGEATHGPTQLNRLLDRRALVREDRGAGRALYIASHAWAEYEARGGLQRVRRADVEEALRVPFELLEIYTGAPVALGPRPALFVEGIPLREGVDIALDITAPSWSAFLEHTQQAVASLEQWGVL